MKSKYFKINEIVNVLFKLRDSDKFVKCVIISIKCGYLQSSMYTVEVLDETIYINGEIKHFKKSEPLILNVEPCRLFKYYSSEISFENLIDECKAGKIN